MGIFRPRRGDHGPDPFLSAKLVLFSVGAAFALAGIATENGLLVGIAIAVLVLGILLRFLPGGRDG